jgi:S1-C subfamily serine protease
VLPNSPADNAGIRTAARFTETDGGNVPLQVDIITAINGTPLHSIDDLIGYLATYTRPGDVVTLTVIRDGRETLQLQATLLARPER